MAQYNVRLGGFHIPLHIPDHSYDRPYALFVDCPEMLAVGVENFATQTERRSRWTSVGA
jgi:hypothetical protein